MARHLITSALPYINGVKHLGNVAGSLLPADVYARYLRLQGEEVLFLCATDEHGTPAELSALEAGVSVQTYCDTMHARQTELYARLGLSFDHFGRTSSAHNRDMTQAIFRRLQDHGFIREHTLRQVYSKTEERFLPDRYVVGTCPRCGYQAARGDQCEQCTSLLDPTDLLFPRSAVSGSAELEIRETNHLFLQIQDLADDVREWIDAHPDWSRLTRSIALKWLDEGLQARCITRDLRWGVPVPCDGYAEKVFYVWFDAPIGYISATQEWADRDAGRDADAWWLDAPDVHYTQFMAKDNVPFHTVFFPAMLFGTKQAWTQPSQIKAFNWLTYYGGKFSTSQKRGVFLDDALSLFDADYWRYFLLAQSPEADDSSFTWDQFAVIVNKDLVGNFGNFVNRTLRLAAAQFGATVPTGGVATEVEQACSASCQEVFDRYRTHLAQLEYRKAVGALRELWSLGNVYLDRTAPWHLIHSDRDQAAMVLRTAILLIRGFAIAALPVIPNTSHTVLDALDVPREERTVWGNRLWDLTNFPGAISFQVPDRLFRRIDREEIDALTARFTGGQSS